MSGADVLSQCRMYGVAVELDGDGLAVSGQREDVAAVRDILRANKAAVMAALAAGVVPVAPPPAELPPPTPEAVSAHAATVAAIPPDAAWLIEQVGHGRLAEGLVRLRGAEVKPNAVALRLLADARIPDDHPQHAAWLAELAELRRAIETCWLATSGAGGWPWREGGRR